MHWYAHMMICSHDDMLIYWYDHHCFCLFETWSRTFIHILICSHHRFHSAYIMLYILLVHEYIHMDTSIKLTPAHAELWFGFTAKRRSWYATRRGWPSWGRWSDHAGSESPWRLLLFIYTWCMIERDMSVLWVVIYIDFWPVPVRLGGDYVDEIFLLLSVLVCVPIGLIGLVWRPWLPCNQLLMTRVPSRDTGCHSWYQSRVQHSVMIGITAFLRRTS